MPTRGNSSNRELRDRQPKNHAEARDEEVTDQPPHLAGGNIKSPLGMMAAQSPSPRDDSPPLWFNDAMTTFVENLENKLKSHIKEQLDLFKNDIKEQMKEQENRFVNLIAACNDRITAQERKIDELGAKMAECEKTKAEEHEKLHEEVHQLRLKLEQQDAVQQSLRKKDAMVTSNTLLLSGDRVPTYKSGERTADVAVEIMKNIFGYHLDKTYISSSSRIGKPPSDGKQDKRGIKLCLNNKVIKDDIVKTNIENFTDGFFINEELIESVNKLYFEIRNIRKNNRDKIPILYTRDGIIKVKRERKGRVTSIFSEKDLDDFKKLVGL